MPLRLAKVSALLVALTALAPVTGCDDGGCPCCDLPRELNDWIIEIDPGPVPDPGNGFPVFIEVAVEVRSLENGTPAPDGQTVTLTVSPGAFVGGGSEIVRALVDGRTTATIRAEAPGSYRFAVTVDGAVRTAWTLIDVGP
jgi:hypothetical protein